MRLIKFGEVDLSPYNADDTFNTQTAKALYELEDGAFDAQANRNYYRPGRITRKFEIWPTDTQTVAEQTEALLKEFRKGRKLLQIETRDGDVRQTWAKAFPVNLQWGRRSAGFQKMTVTFETDDPLWRLRSDDPTYTDEGTEVSGDWATTAGQVESESFTTLPHTFTINNTGNAPVRGGFLRVTSGSNTSEVAEDVSGNAADGDYKTGMTLDDPGITALDVGPDFAGNEMMQFHSTAFSSGFDPNDFTVSMWLKADSWTSDGTNRRFLNIRADVNNRLECWQAGSTNGRLNFLYTGGGTGTTRSVDGNSTIDAFHVMITVNTTTPAMYVYIDGVTKVGPYTGIGTWTGSLNSNYQVVGEFDNVPSSLGWKGGIYHLAIWDTVQSQTTANLLWQARHNQEKYILNELTTNLVGYWPMDDAYRIGEIRIDNLTTGHWIRYADNVSEGEELEIDLRRSRVDVDGADAYQAIGLPDDKGHFMELAVGNNSISVDANRIRGSIDLDWQWSKHYY